MGTARRGFWVGAGVLLLVGALASSGPAHESFKAAARLHTLIVGGGPDAKHNQVAIESNVRYVSRLLPVDATSRVLFTDGDPLSKNVLCEDPDEKTYYRAPQIARIDGPSSPEQIQQELFHLSNDAVSTPTSPVLLYFTGHGSPNYSSQYANNNYDLWNDKHLTVKDLAGSLQAFPKQTPITLVMVECFSGAFGNLLFKDADAKGDLANINVCGFFASVAQRMAAGCTSEVNEANYRDFTSYFFAALTGTDRTGRKVTGADYNHDGKVGMNEAFAYSLIHDDSIDTPVCTSDVFLRRFVESTDSEVLSTPFRTVQSWASPSQLAALNALSDATGFTGDDGLGRAFDFFSHMRMDSDEPKEVKTLRLVRLAKSIILGHRLMASSDEALKSKFTALLKLESANPLR